MLFHHLQKQDSSVHVDKCELSCEWGKDDVHHRLKRVCRRAQSKGHTHMTLGAVVYDKHCTALAYFIQLNLPRGPSGIQFLKHECTSRRVFTFVCARYGLIGLPFGGSQPTICKIDLQTPVLFKCEYYVRSHSTQYWLCYAFRIILSISSLPSCLWRSVAWYRYKSVGQIFDWVSLWALATSMHMA